jgi:superfamily II DNA helicase RecQ
VKLYASNFINRGTEFRPLYQKTSIMQSLLPDVPVLALSATVHRNTFQDITDILALDEAEIVEALPDRYIVTFWRMLTA